MIIELKVTPHVKQFICSKMKSEIINLSEKSWQTDILTFRMKSNFKKNSFKPEFKKLVALKIQLPQILERNYKGKILNYQLENYYDSYFKDMLCAHIEGQVRSGFTITNSIRDFFLLYDIDESSINEETAYKIWQRKLMKEKIREEKNKKNNA